MGLFGFGREEKELAEQQRKMEADMEAERHYRKLESGFASRRLRLHTVSPAEPFPEQSYLFAREKDEFLFLPDLNVYQTDAEILRTVEVLRYPAARLTITKDEPARTPIRREGILDVYPIMSVTLRIAVDGGEPVAFTATNVESNAKFLKEVLPECGMRNTYDVLDRPEDAVEVYCQKGSGLLPSDARCYLWREGEALHFLRKGSGLYGRTDEVRYGILPISDIESFGREGHINYETRVSGGEVQFDASAAFWSEWDHPFRLNSHYRALEDAISTAPIRTEKIERDERYIELRVQWEGQRVNLEFGPKTMEIFEQLIPEKSEGNLPADREPTIPEQLEILANVCDRGYLTREEFEEAKKKLLAKL